MNMKRTALIILLGVAIGFLLGKIVITPPPPGKPEVKIEWKKDSSEVQAMKLQLESIEGRLELERQSKSWAFSDAQKWRAFYQRLADSIGGAYGPVEIPIARLDTTIASVEGKREYKDTVSVEYVFPPVNAFSKVRIGMQQRWADYKYPVVTVTTKEREPLPLVKGLFLGSQLSGRYGDGLLDLSAKEFAFSGGLTLQGESVLIDIIPFDYRLTQNHAESWYALAAKFYILRN